MWDTLTRPAGSPDDLIFVITHYVWVVWVVGALEIDFEPGYEQYRPFLQGRRR